MTRTGLMLALSLTVACGDKDDESTDSGGADGTDAADAGDGGDGSDAADAGDGGDGTTSETPYIDSGRVICVPPTSGPEAIVLELTAADPQGPDTLRSFADGHPGLWRASGGGIFFEDIPLSCDPTGWCTASVRSEDHGISCAEGPSINFEVNLYDEDGNESGWTSVAWEG